MKLIDLLVKELPRRGGWPEGAGETIEMHMDGDVFFDGDRAPDEFTLPQCSDGWAPGMVFFSNEVTREQYESALAASEGWIEWGGGECPVETGALVDIRIGDGCELYGVKAAPKAEYSHTVDMFWEHKGSPDNNIIAYRLHKPEINSRANDDRLEQDLNECIGQDVDMPEWSGDGLPPVGCECEVRFGGFSWVTCKVVYRGDAGVAFVYSDNSTIDCVGTGRDDYFRPLRTEAEKAREKLAASLHIAAGASPIELNGIGPLYFKLSDAIISGSVFGTTFKAGK